MVSTMNIWKYIGKCDLQLRKKAINRNQSWDGPAVGFNKDFKAAIMKMYRELKEDMFKPKHSMKTWF